MRIFDAIPFKAVLAAASITTVAVVALAVLSDTEVVDYGVPPPAPLVVQLPDPPPPPAPPPVDLQQPIINVSF